MPIVTSVKFVDVASQAERLAVTDKRRVEGARAGVAHDYYSQFSFKPAINERSRRLAKVRTSLPLRSPPA